jgi:fatty acid desaturase
LGRQPEEGEVVYGKENEKPTTRKTRIGALAIAWLVGITLLIGLWFWFGWWVLILVAVGVWASVDYLRRGDQAGHVDRLKWGF